MRSRDVADDALGWMAVKTACRERDRGREERVQEVEGVGGCDSVCQRQMQMTHRREAEAAAVQHAVVALAEPKVRVSWSKKHVG